MRYVLWVHKNCSGVKGRLKADSNYQCLKCQVKGKTTIGVGKKEHLLLSSGTSVDCVEEFCYLGICLVLEVEHGKCHE